MTARQDPHAGPLRVLMVVDHEPLAEVLRLHLDDSERIEQVTSVRSTDDVLDAVARSSAAVVLVDDQTHNDAIEVCRLVSSERPNVPCIVLGTALEPGDEQAALDSGAAAYVVKSLTGASVSDVVHEVFDHRGSRTADPARSAC